MRPRPRKHRRGQTLPGNMISKEELARRSEELKARAVRLMLLLETRAGHKIDWSTIEGGRPENAEEILASLGRQPATGERVSSP